jgi:crossover junction endodeoxyribonuclease RusA
MRRAQGSVQTAGVTTAAGPAGPAQLPVEFIVDGVPVSAQSANKTRRAQWTGDVAARASAAWSGAPVSMDVAVVITYYGRGGWAMDLDNMSKPILDAMSGIVWVDDKQLVTLSANRRELGGAYVIEGISPVLALAFVLARPFLHVLVTDPPDMTMLP